MTLPSLADPRTRTDVSTPLVPVVVADAADRTVLEAMAGARGWVQPS